MAKPTFRLSDNGWYWKFAAWHDKRFPHNIWYVGPFDSLAEAYAYATYSGNRVKKASW